MASLLEIAKKINKDYNNDNIIRRSDVIPSYRRLASGAFAMDYPLYGGLPLGRICVYSGKFHSGKTLAATCELAAFQREYPDKICVFVDVEHALDLKFQVMMNHVDPEKLVIFSPSTGMSGEQILAEVMRMQTESDDIGMIVIDSIPALVTAQNLKNEFTKDMGKQGTIAKSMHKFLTEITPSLEEKQNILILINQVRVKDVMYNGAPIYSEPGGDAPGFYSSVSVRFGSRVFMKGDEELGATNTGEGATGFKLRFSITKNKTAPTNRGGGWISYRYDTGIDTLRDLLEIAINFDMIRRLSTVTYQLVNLETGEVYVNEDNGKLLQGKKKDLVEYIMTHDDFRKSYIDMLTRFISAENTNLDSNVRLLSEEEAKEISEEEEAVNKEAQGK